MDAFLGKGKEDMKIDYVYLILGGKKEARPMHYTQVYEDTELIWNSTTAETLDKLLTDSRPGHLKC